MINEEALCKVYGHLHFFYLTPSPLRSTEFVFWCGFSTRRAKTRFPHFVPGDGEEVTTDVKEEYIHSHGQNAGAAANPSRSVRAGLTSSD